MRRYASLILIIFGLIILASVIIPIGLSNLSFISKPKFLDPTAVALSPIPFVSTILGATTSDYAQSSAWFPTAAFSPTPSRVGYYTLSIPSLNMYDVSVEINGENLKKTLSNFPVPLFPALTEILLFLATLLCPNFTNPATPFLSLIPYPRSKTAPKLLSATMESLINMSSALLSKSNLLKSKFWPSATTKTNSLLSPVSPWVLTCAASSPAPN